MTMQPAPNNDAGTVAPAPGTQPAAGTVVQPDYKALYEQAQAEITTLKGEDWYKRAVGWQQTYNNAKSQWETEKQRLENDAQRLKAIEDEHKSTISKHAELDTQFKTTKEEADRLKSELEVHKTGYERLNVIVSEFPELLPFLRSEQDKDGQKTYVDLLPTGTGEDLKTKLQAFSARIQVYGSSVKDGTNPGPNGATPPAPKGKQPSALEDAWSKVLAASKSGNVAEYDKAYDEFIKLKTSQ